MTQVASGGGHPDLDDSAESIERSPFLSRLMSRDEPMSQRTSVNLITVGCALAAFGLLIASEFKVWLRLLLVTASGPVSGTGIPVTMQRIQSVQSFAYYLGWLAILGLLGTAAAIDRRHRRVVAATGAGLVAGVVFFLVNLIGAAKLMFETAVDDGTNSSPNTYQVHLQSGFVLACGAALFALIGFGAALWVGRRPGRPPRSRSDQYAQQPAVLDLSVSPSGRLPEPH